MSLLPHHLPLFHPWTPQPTLDALVSALWQGLCPGRRVVSNHDLGPIFGKMTQDPELATMPLYTNYFDPVTEHLPKISPFAQNLNYNLQLNCFDSWADPDREWERAGRQRHVPSYGGPRMSGNCPSRFPRNRDPGESRGPVTNSQYNYQMYDYNGKLPGIG
ncbi:hypothetical protein DPEC_G00351350 [Dallia pectoralis]|uniref:Uncharacterized protein n=1 Tax=Dallia pectoralis TaxID=75939 RepID=A0ACC2F1X9_DALPE|nr:hypothetical protein DPEC_G00351350 [Dallia pectoralis]